MSLDTEPIHLQHNESYWLLDDELLGAYGAAGSKEWATYPEYGRFKQDVATYAGIDQHQVCITAGSDMAIELLARLFAAQDKHALLPVPSFYGYERIFSRTRLSFDMLCYRERAGAFEFPLDETLDAIIKNRIDVLFLCQPNNPLGCDIPDDTLTTLLDACAAAHVLVVSDEAYFEFSGKTAIFRVQQQPLVIVRTFSKGFGLSGARVGYAIAERSLIEQIDGMQLPWPVAHPSVYAGREGLRLVDSLKKRVELVKQARDTFAGQLNELPGVHTFPSSTNFLLARIPQAERVAQKLAEQQIFVAMTKTMSSLPAAQELLSSTLRFGVPSPEHLPRVLETLKNALV